jgi:hypothetical protein
MTCNKNSTSSSTYHHHSFMLKSPFLSTGFLIMSNNFTTTPEIVSYGIGRQMGDQLASDPFDGISAQAVAAGVIDSLEGTASY